jgi:hypothetical protein
MEKDIRKKKNQVKQCLPTQFSYYTTRKHIRALHQDQRNNQLLDKNISATKVLTQHGSVGYARYVATTSVF